MLSEIERQIYKDRWITIWIDRQTFAAKWSLIIIMNDNLKRQIDIKGDRKID